MRLFKWITIAGLIFTPLAQAGILWAGGEDVDFPNGGTVCSTSNYRSSYARAGIYACSSVSLATSNTFTGGVITSGWLSAQIFGGYNTSDKYIGFTKLGTNSSLWIGTDSATATKLALWKYDGTTWTQVAAESTTSIPFNMITKVDMELINYGASATVNLYANGSATPALSFTGNVLAGSATTLDRVILRSFGAFSSCSELIVSDSDTRKLSLATLAPNAAGDLTQWSGAYTNINPVTINDASVVSDITTGNIFQANLTNLPSTSFQVLAVRLAARTTKTGSGVTSIALGVKTNTTVSSPAATAQLATWGTTETLYLNNPVTAVPWTPTEINALQINLQTAP